MHSLAGVIVFVRGGERERVCLYLCAHVRVCVCVFISCVIVCETDHMAACVAVSVPDDQFSSCARIKEQMLLTGQAAPLTPP